MSKTLITSRDPKGLQIAGLFDSVLNKAKLDQDRAQRLIENGGKFQEGIARLIDKLSVLEPVRGWIEKDGVIYFSVTSDGTTGEQWITRLEGEMFNVGRYTKSVLRSKDFKPTKSVTTEIAVLKGESFSDSDRITTKIRIAATEKHKLAMPNAEVACLIREKFTDDEIKAMGLWYIVVMHEPIKDSFGDSGLLCASRGGDGRWLFTYYDRLNNNWDRVYGFAFAVCK